MRSVARTVLLLAAAAFVAGCLAGPTELAGERETSLDRVPGADADRAALASELWCPACVEDGLRARSLRHDVLFRATDGGSVVFVEIDGVLACAGRADVAVALGVELEGTAPAEHGEDEGNPDPEPALDDELPPSPAPPPQVNAKGEDEGNPDPEPALDQPLPGPGRTPGLGDPGSFGGAGT